MTFGKNLQALRKEKGLSQDALANQLYVTRQSVSQWENDKTMPSVDLLLRLSEIFDTTVDALLGKPQTESIPQPIAAADILHSKKEIKSALRYEYATAAIVLFSLAALFIGLSLAVQSYELQLFSPEIAPYHGKDMMSAWRYTAASISCLAAGVVTVILGKISAAKAIRFGSSHACTLRFFYDHLVIEEEGQEPLRLFYANIRRITETDTCFVFKMQNKVKMCVLKSALENPAEVSKLLKSAKSYLDRRLSRSDTPLSKTQRCLIRLFRDFLFVATFFSLSAASLSCDILLTEVTKNQPLRWTLFILPFAVLAVAIALGVVWCIRGIKAKRMIIAGGAALAVTALFVILFHSGGQLYDLQSERVTSEQFISYMETHGLEVEDTIKGRQENFISKCYTAHPHNKSFHILYMEFDPYSNGYGLFAAREAYGDLKNEITSQPRTSTVYSGENLVFNQFYTETTNNHYAYLSLNEYSVIRFEVSPERKAELQEVLQDWELPLPY